MHCFVAPASSVQQSFNSNIHPPCDDEAQKLTCIELIEKELFGLFGSVGNLAIRSLDTMRLEEFHGDVFMHVEVSHGAQVGVGAGSSCQTRQTTGSGGEHF